MSYLAPESESLKRILFILTKHTLLKSQIFTFEKQTSVQYERFLMRHRHYIHKHNKLSVESDLRLNVCRNEIYFQIIL